MIIWRGKGLAILGIAFGGLLLSEATTRTLWDDHYYQDHGWPKLMGFWMAAGLLYILRPWLGVGRKQELVDKATGKSVVINHEAALFFVPAGFWPIILVVGGFATLLIPGASN